VVSRQSEPDWETTMAKVVPNRIKEARLTRYKRRKAAHEEESALAGMNHESVQ
jgi:hypothetical protein